MWNFSAILFWSEPHLPTSRFLPKPLCTKAFQDGRSLADTSRWGPVQSPLEGCATYHFTLFTFHFLIMCGGRSEGRSKGRGTGGMTGGLRNAKPLYESRFQPTDGRCRMKSLKFSSGDSWWIWNMLTNPLSDAIWVSWPIYMGLLAWLTGRSDNSDNYYMSEFGRRW